MRVAALTMVWNESHFLPIWRRHYGRQLGEQNCFIIDHGSDDGSTDQIGPMTCIRMPRTKLDEEKRAAAVSHIAAGLLSYYDVVLHTDVDELLVADPEVATDLLDFCRKCSLPVVTAIGLDVNHAPRQEADIDDAELISRQRRWVRFVSPMCKPAMIRRPVQWRPGFHSCDAEIAFDRLFIFHLRRYDMKNALIRLAKTRQVEWAHDNVSGYQRISDEQYTADFMYGVGHMPDRRDVTLHPGDAPLRDWLTRIEDEQQARATEYYRLDLGLIANEFWQLPPRFVGSF